MNVIDTLANVAILTPGDGGPWDGNYDGEWWWWVIRPLTFVLTILVIAFIIRFVVFGGFRGFGGPRRGGPDRDEPSGIDRARDILAERYARGEISSEEYRGRLDQLG